MSVKFANFDWQIAKQSARGTGATVMTDLLRCLSGSSAGAERNTDVKRTGDSGRAADGISVASGISGGGELNIVTQYQGLGLLLYLALGKVTTTGTTVKSHAFVPEQSAGLPYFTALKRVDDHYEYYKDCKIDSLALAVSAKDRLVVAKLKFLAASEVEYRDALDDAPAITAATPEDSTKRFDWNQARGAWTADGDLIGYINELVFTVNNNLQPIDGEGLLPYDVQEGPMDLLLDYKISMVDWAKYNKLMFGDETPATGDKVTAVVPTGSFQSVFTAVAASPGPEVSLAVAATNLEFRNAIPKVDGDPDGKVVELPLQARCVGADPKVTLTLKNDRASY